jgi:hypothetical protein
MANDIVMPMSPKVKKTNFKGTPRYSFSILKYLKKKYKNIACVVVPKIKININLKHTDLSLRWIQTNDKEGNFSIPKNYWNYFRKCINNNSRFIIFPFGFNCTYNLGHANYIIYDKKYKSMERFEPYGKTKRKCTNPKNIDYKIEKLFNDNLSDGKDKFILKYYKPLDFLSKESFQRIQENEKDMGENDPPGGYCVIWSCWYAELRLNNYCKNRKYLVDSALKNIIEKNTSLTEYIRNYSEDIVKKLN